MAEAGGIPGVVKEGKLFKRGQYQDVLQWHSRLSEAEALTDDSPH